MLKHQLHIIGYESRRLQFWVACCYFQPFSSRGLYHEPEFFGCRSCEEKALIPTIPNSRQQAGIETATILFIGCLSSHLLQFSCRDFDFCLLTRSWYAIHHTNLQIKLRCHKYFVFRYIRLIWVGYASTIIMRISNYNEYFWKSNRNESEHSRVLPS